MQRRSVEAIVDALNQRDVRYLVVGGLAVVAYGHLRLTADVDLVIDLEPENVRRAVAALVSLNYRPRAPVPFEEFADPIKRRAWIREKGLTVFSLYSPDHSATEIDVFVEAPFDFSHAYASARWMEVGPGVSASFAARADLIALKRLAGRPEDLEDVRRLLELDGDIGNG